MKTRFCVALVILLALAGCNRGPQPTAFYWRPAAHIYATQGATVLTYVGSNQYLVEPSALTFTGIDPARFYVMKTREPRRIPKEVRIDTSNPSIMPIGKYKLRAEFVAAGKTYTEDLVLHITEAVDFGLKDTTSEDANWHGPGHVKRPIGDVRAIRGSHRVTASVSDKSYKTNKTDTTDGSTDSYRTHANILGANSEVTECHLYRVDKAAGMYDPQKRGQIMSVDFTATQKVEGAAVEIGFIIHQNGNIYLSKPMNLKPNGWQRIEAKGLNYGEFQGVDGGRRTSHHGVNPRPYGSATGSVAKTREREKSLSATRWTIGL